MKKVQLFEEYSANQVKCRDCGWKWRLEEGGNDPYVCHKCCCDNTPEINVHMRIQEAEDKETYNDYPAAAKANAKKALDWRDEYGRDEVTAGTPVGWQRANQLAKGEKLSRDVISRMAQFNRHRKNSKIDPELKSTPWKDNGYVAWLIWGGDEGVDWAIKKISEIDEKG